MLSAWPWMNARNRTYLWLTLPQDVLDNIWVHLHRLAVYRAIKFPPERLPNFMIYRPVILTDELFDFFLVFGLQQVVEVRAAGNRRCRRLPRGRTRNYWQICRRKWRHGVRSERTLIILLSSGHLAFGYLALQCHCFQVQVFSLTLN